MFPKLNNKRGEPNKKGGWNLSKWNDLTLTFMLLSIKILTFWSLYQLCRGGERIFFSKINKQGGLNKRGEGIFFQKLINGEALIRVSRVENIPKINKRACLFIRDLRVLTSKLPESIRFDLANYQMAVLLQTPFHFSSFPGHANHTGALLEWVNGCNCTHRFWEMSNYAHQFCRLALEFR